ncbi:hypothetical protein CPC08DRAFT_812692 [Agrocybe pediades]|nr:hypothetical protein CPC08DRAFT_812692 [Agrocybe pediades]
MSSFCSRPYSSLERSSSSKSSRSKYTTKSPWSLKHITVDRVDQWSERSQETHLHRGKRRRHENTLPVAVVEKCTEPSAWSGSPQSDEQVVQRPRLATSSSQFSLFARRESTSIPSASRRHQSLDSKGPTKNREDFVPDLVRLRSSAFWELRQSIAENGEGLIRRMRDYEHSRSRHQVYQKAKDAEKRGRKRLARCKRAIPQPPPSDASESDEEDILISLSSGDFPRHTLWGSSLGKRARSLDAMDVQQSEWSGAQPERCSSPTSSPHLSRSRVVDDADILHEFGGTTMPECPSFSDPPSWGRSSSSSSTTESPNSSVLSLPMSTSSANNNNHLPLSASNDKALNELSFALANGAGIADYSPVHQYQAHFDTLQSYDHGDLWK